MATHSSILAWRIPWAEDPDRLQSTESQRVGTTEPLMLPLTITTTNNWKMNILEYLQSGTKNKN